MNKPKSGSVNGELVAVGRTAEVNTRSTDIPKGNESSRVAQLEQNIRFLQEQHSQMLAGLHKEIDNLRHRNRGNYLYYHTCFNTKRGHVLNNELLPIFVNLFKKLTVKLVTMGIRPLCILYC